MDTFINDGFIAGVGAVRSTVDRTGVRGKGNVASASVQRPCSDIDKAKAGRFKSKTGFMVRCKHAVSKCFGQGTFKLGFDLREFID